MRLTEDEREQLLITLAADVAERRRGRGLRLNNPRRPGKLADLVLWEPAFFGVLPHVVLKVGVIA